MNKKVGLFLVALLLSSFLISFISAADPNPLTDAAKKVGTFLSDAVKFIIGSSSTIAGYNITAVLLAKLLLLIILFSMIWSVLEFMPFMNDGWPRWTLSIIVSILGIRFLTDELIATIILPYSVLAVSMTALIPFIIYFLFVERGINSSTGRKLAWTFFGATFLLLWAYRMGLLGATTKDTLALGSSGYIYLITAAISLVMLLLDRTIHSWFTKEAIKRIAEAGNQAQMAAVTAKINWAQSVIGTSVGNATPTWPAALGAAPTWYAAVKTATMDREAEKFINNQRTAISRLMRV